MGVHSEKLKPFLHSSKGGGGSFAAALYLHSEKLKPFLRSSKKSSGSGQAAVSHKETALFVITCEYHGPALLGAAGLLPSSSLRKA
jgi:hypothetical protein